MFDLKPLCPEAVPAAMARATRYRLLNEPSEAESICLDVLGVEPENQQAIATLILALSDRFPASHAHEAARARELVGRLRKPYDRAYYAGIISERLAKALLKQAGPGAAPAAYAQFEQAMKCYEQAEGLRPLGNDDARLRWNACARLIMQHHLGPPAEEALEPALE